MYLWKDSRLKLRITRLGVQYVLVTGVVGLLGLFTSNNLLHAIFGMMIGLLLVSGWASRAAILGIEPESVATGTFFAKAKGGLRLRLVDKCPTRTRCLEISAAIPGCPSDIAFYQGGRRMAEKRGRGGEPSAVLKIWPSKRGRAKIASVDFCTSYPFGFLEKTVSFPFDAEFLVAPHPTGFDSSNRGRGDYSEPSPLSGFSSPDGARPFAIGDSISKIYWKRTAQRGEPWSRNMEGDLPKGLELELDLDAWAPGDDFEHELERLSGAILEARLLKSAVTLHIFKGGRCTDAAGAIAAWRVLSLAEANGQQSPEPLAKRQFCKSPEV
ncbi:MAG: DUF58 domain-containing protein [Holophagales bacterium]|nr:DUF58 domain-containing protein [Holophagales bacterium]